MRTPLNVCVEMPLRLHGDITEFAVESPLTDVCWLLTLPGRCTEASLLLRHVGRGFQVLLESHLAEDRYVAVIAVELREVSLHAFDHRLQNRIATRLAESECPLLRLLLALLVTATCIGHLVAL